MRKVGDIEYRLYVRADISRCKDGRHDHSWFADRDETCLFSVARSGRGFSLVMESPSPSFASQEAEYESALKPPRKCQWFGKSLWRS